MRAYFSSTCEWNPVGPSPLPGAWIIIICSPICTVLYCIIIFRPTIDDISYVSIVTSPALLEALHSYCCLSSVSIWMDAGS